MKRLLAALLIAATPAFATIADLSNGRAAPQTANGATTVFSFSFPVSNKTDVQAIVTLAGVAQVAPYTVAINSDQTASPGGSVTFTAAPANTAIVAIQRTQSLNQLTSFSPYFLFPSKVVERTYDSVTMKVQQNARDIADLAAKEASDISNTIAGGVGATNLFTFTPTGTSTSHTAADWFQLLWSAKAFNVKCDGVADDRAALVAAMAAQSVVTLPAGTCLIGSAFTIPAFVTLQGAGRRVTILKRTFTGDMITDVGAYATIRDLTIDGDTATRGAGRGIHFVSTGAGNQSIYNSEIKNFSQSCLEFEQDAGSEFTSISSSYFTTGTIGVQAAVKTNGVDSAAVPRKFYGTTSGGCTLFDLGGVNHFWADGFYTNGMIFSSASAFNVELRHARFGSLGGVITAQGDSHFFSGVSAVVWNTSTTGSVFDLQTPSWVINDTGSGNSINQVGFPYTPVWTGASVNPVLGNGALTGRASRRGGWVRVEVDLTFGSTTTQGTGAWSFSLPVADLSFTPIQVCGSGYGANNAGSAGSVYVVRVTPGAQKVTLFAPSGTNILQAAPTVPFVYDTGTTVRFFCEYRVP